MVISPIIALRAATNPPVIFQRPLRTVSRPPLVRTVADVKYLWHYLRYDKLKDGSEGLGLPDLCTYNIHRCSC